MEECGSTPSLAVVELAGSPNVCIEISSPDMQAKFRDFCCLK
jgi:hypothetical protein